MPRELINFFAGIGIISTFIFVVGGAFLIYEIRHAREVEDEHE